MNFSYGDLLPIDEILSEVLRLVDDEETRYKSKGFYAARVRNAITELAIDTWFDKKTYDFDVPSDCKIAMIDGMFNIRDMFLFNNSECCGIDESTNGAVNSYNGSVRVFWKRNYNNQHLTGKGLANNQEERVNDPFIAGNAWARFPENDNLYYFNIQNGLIMLSPNATNYSKLRVEYNSYGNEGERIIPRIVREGVVHHAAVSALKMSLIQRPEVANILGVLKQDLGNDFRGHWADAKRRLKRMGKKQYSDMREYFKRSNA